MLCHELQTRECLVTFPKTSKNVVTLKPRDSTSLKTPPFYIPTIITYCRSLEAMDLSISCRFGFENTATLKSRSGVTQDRRWFNTQQIGYGFLLVFDKETLSVRHIICEILNFEKYRELETGVRGHWKSLKMTLFDTTLMTSYWRSIWLYVVPCRRYSMLKMSWP